jgi:hypothetical protein
MCAHVSAAGMLPLLKMARSKLDHHMQQQQQQQQHKITSHAPTSCSSTIVSPNDTIPELSSAPCGLNHEGSAAGCGWQLPMHAPLLSSPAGFISRASPLQFASTPGTLLKNRNAVAEASPTPLSAVAPITTPPPTSKASRVRAPSRALAPAPAPAAAACHTEACAVLDTQSSVSKSFRPLAAGGWSASAFAQGRARGLLSVKAHCARDDVGEADAADCGSLGDMCTATNLIIIVQNVTPRR